MEIETKTNENGSFIKIATTQSTPTAEPTPKVVAIEHGLTIFLGGAGMVGAYNEDMITALKEAGISNAVHGNYSSLIRGMDQYVSDTLDMLSDASAVVFYNQDDNDSVVLEYGQLPQCDYSEEYTERKYLFGTVTVKQYDEVVCTPSSDLLAMRISRDIEAVKATEFPLSAIGIEQPLPSTGQFNIIGYSWGAVIAARTAIYHARRGVKVDHLVLIGAPINKSLKDAVNSHPNIGLTTIIDLQDKGDPIYAGITDEELMRSTVELGRQMISGGGHFYYSGDNEEGKQRRRLLAQDLNIIGLR